VNRRVLHSLVNAAALLALASVMIESRAQDSSKEKSVTVGLFPNQRPAPTGPVRSLKDGTPDLAGVWLGGGGSDADISNPARLKPGNTVVMLPWAEDVVKNRLSEQDPEANCLPTGIPRGSPYPWRILQTPERYYILFEGNIHSFRQIFMDGRPHPPARDLDPTWYGHSIGHWEGNTLVVDTVGFNDKFWFDYKGHPHTEQLHTIERYTPIDEGHMAIEVTIEDPGAYKQPFTTMGRATLLPGAELMEYICQENNQDLDHLSGPARGPGNQ